MLSVFGENCCYLGKIYAMSLTLMYTFRKQVVATFGDNDLLPTQFARLSGILYNLLLNSSNLQPI